MTTLHGYIEEKLEDPEFAQARRETIEEEKASHVISFHEAFVNMYTTC